VDDAVSDLEYDLSSRHVLVAKLVDAVAGPGLLLDIGGSKGLTKQLLPGRTVVTVDVRREDIDAVASGAALPFADRSFSVALALDVLEHVPEPVKWQLVDEAARVAHVVVLAGPYATPEVEAAERHQRELFQALFGHDHPWLSEHAESGLPVLEATVNRLRSHGLSVGVLGSNPLALWEAQLFNSHVALKVGFNEQTLPLRRWLAAEFLDRADATPPSYRHIVVGSRRPGVVSAVRRIRPGRDAQLVREAVVRSEVSTSHVLAHGWEVLEGIRTEAIDRWTESAETVRRMESTLREMPDPRTVESLERLVNDEGSWRAALAGPPIAEAGLVDTFPDAHLYADWLSSRAISSPPLHGPLISVVTPVHDPSSEHLTACIRSVRSQTYRNWELVLVDASEAPHVRPICQRFAALDERIKVVHRVNAGIAGNTNTGVEESKGDWIAFLDHDDVLEDHALAAVAHRVLSNPDLEFIYSDEDKIAPSGELHHPFLKPDWSPDLLRCVNYIAHLVAVSRTLFTRVGGVRAGYEGAQDFDFVLRATAAARSVGHISDVLYHWRQHPASTAADVRTKPKAHDAGRRALQDFALDHAGGSWVEAGAGPTSHRLRYALRYQLVSAIVPFRDQVKLTDRLLRAIAMKGHELPIEVLLVSNRSNDPATDLAMEAWNAEWDFVRCYEFDEPFNFQRLNNEFARRASGDLLLFLNNDTEPLHVGWLEALAEHAQRPEIGAVGPRLFYPNGLIQHAGVAVGIGGFAEHPWAHLSPDAQTPAGPSYWTRNFLAVTAACLMVERSKFDSVGGFDERFIVCGGDVDLGIRLHQAGYRNVMTPFARLIHHEAATRDQTPPASDVDQSLIAYAPFLNGRDPYYNANLTLSDTSCSIRSPKDGAGVGESQRGSFASLPSR